MQSRGLERYAPLTGLVFFALAVALTIIGGDTPDVDEPTQDVVDYWSSHDGEAIATGILSAYAAILLVWFASSLRSAIAAREGPPARLATLAFGGAVLFAVGATVGGSISFALGDAAGEVPDDVVQALSVISSDMFLPFVAGIALTTLATGLAALRFGVLPRWLGWVSIAIAVISVTPIGFIGFIAGVIWIAVVSVLLYAAPPTTATRTEAARPQP